MVPISVRKPYNTYFSLPPYVGLNSYKKQDRRRVSSYSIQVCFSGVNRSTMIYENMGYWYLIVSCGHAKQVPHKRREPHDVFTLLNLQHHRFLDHGHVGATVLFISMLSVLLNGTKKCISPSLGEHACSQSISAENEKERNKKEIHEEERKWITSRKKKKMKLSSPPRCDKHCELGQPRPVFF